MTIKRRLARRRRTQRACRTVEQERGRVRVGGRRHARQQVGAPEPRYRVLRRALLHVYELPQYRPAIPPL